MILVKRTLDLENYLDSFRKDGGSVGFIPTMGALHGGHMSLLNLCNKQADITVCSIFVNPTQFTDYSDFLKYPVTIEADIFELEQAGCDILFLPSVEEIYPTGTRISKVFELGELDHFLEGKYRPGHFQGVCQVVERLLEIVKPDMLFLGQKDYQQCMVINKLIETTGMPVSVVIVETIREPTGLAMSSRNMRLNQSEKKIAAGIYACLIEIKNDFQVKSFPVLLNEVKEKLVNSGFSRVEYVAITNAGTFEIIDKFEKGKPAMALIAAYVGDVRLIDNMVLTTP